jgi:hypothetical protein
VAALLTLEKVDYCKVHSFEPSPGQAQGGIYSDPLLHIARCIADPHLLSDQPFQFGLLSPEEHSAQFIVVSAMG